MSAVRVRLDIAYDGAGFSGWARQAEPTRTVQGVIEDALALASRSQGDDDPPRLVVAGRTDAGVHASGQVAHVDLTHEQIAAILRRDTGDIGMIARRLTGIIGVESDVVVKASSPAPAGFDARFSAIWRRYRYRIADRLSERDPLQRHVTAAQSGELDLDRMNATALRLIGFHDFAAFCRPRPFATTIRTLEEFVWRRDEYGTVIAEVRADAFCHGMVRALVGLSTAVGSGRLQPDRATAALAANGRTNEFASAPAHGLTLVEVGYPADDALADQALRARAVRQLG